MIKYIFLLAQLSFSFAVDANVQLPGSFSLKEPGKPATDLIYKHRVLTVPEAIELREQGYDLSSLPPKMSDIWQEKGFIRESIDLPVEGTEFDYQGVLLSRLGNFRFNAKNEFGYTFLLGKKSFTTLLRARLLEKLGYKVPAIKRVPSIILNFNTETEKNVFIEDLTQASFADPRSNRWIIYEDKKSLKLQDVIIMNQNQNFYNLALGAMSSDVIKGRRVFNSLLAVFNLLDITESINLLSFESHRVFGESIILPYDLAKEFSANIEDIQWIGRRIAKLSRNDWVEVVENAKLPNEVSIVLLEKILSRRNALLRAIELDTPAIEFDSSPTMGEYLVQGKILKENWQGYASRFAYGDPETPLSSSEIRNFFKSKLISNAIINSVDIFNTKFLSPDLNTDTIINKQYDKARLDYLFRVFEGKSKKTDLYFYSYPVAGGQLISSRNVTIGGIEGGESKIMLADSFGFRLYGGYRAGTFDFPRETEIVPGVDLGVSRVYTHLTPILSLKKALKTPFKNLLVKWSQKNTYKPCSSILNVDDEIEETEIENCYKLLDESFEVGESLIITDTVDLGGSIKYTQNLDALLKASASLAGLAVTIRKTHLHRVSKDEFQLYIDKGVKGSITLGFSINYGVQVLSISSQFVKGSLKTNFHPWSLKKDPEIKDKKHFLAGIIRFLTSAKSDLIRSQVSPYRLKHSFGTRQRDFSFLIWRKAWRTNNIRSSITHQDDKKGEYTKEFITYSKGKRSGKNYVQLLANTFLAFLGDADDDNSVSFDLGDDRDPANTPYGHSNTREVVFESELSNLGAQQKLEKPLINIHYKWRGWKVKKRKANEIVSNINKKFNFPFFHQDVFNQTRNIQIYNIGIKVTFYEEFIHKMINIDENILKKYLEINYRALPRVSRHPKRPRINNKRERIRRALNKIRKYKSNWNNYATSGNTSKAYKSVTKMVSLLEAYIPFKELIKMVDSKQYFAIGFINGFRAGDENGDSNQFSHAMGTMGDRYEQGKLDFLRNQIGMIPNQFYGHWFIGLL